MRTVNLLSQSWTNFFTDGKVFDGDPSIFRKIFKLFVASCLALCVYNCLFSKSNKNSKSSNNQNSSDSSSKPSQGGVKNFLFDTAKTVFALKAYDMFKDWSSSKDKKKEEKDNSSNKTNSSGNSKSRSNKEEDFSYSDPDDFK